MIQFVVSIILFFVLFFGIAFIVNMLLRRTWIMSFIYPFIVLLIVDEFAISTYFTAPVSALTMVGNEFVMLKISDIFILLSGFLGTIVAGYVIKKLRKSGYQMF